MSKKCKKKQSRAQIIFTDSSAFCYVAYDGLLLVPFKKRKNKYVFRLIKMRSMNTFVFIYQITR